MSGGSAVQILATLLCCFIMSKSPSIASSRRAKSAAESCCAFPESALLLSSYKLLIFGNCNSSTPVLTSSNEAALFDGQ
ncbi:hypothetical protein GGR51DRAFT_540684 [Nemania sp. FL0031]|nr:hypothetical protein GGR51DRAFT_540684 [Nemania sp. FL0031]